MSIAFWRFGLAVLSIVSACRVEVQAGQQESPAYWGKRSAAAATTRLALFDDAFSARRHPAGGAASVRQIGGRILAANPYLSVFERWYVQRMCRVHAAKLSEYCERRLASPKAADFADSLTRAPVEATAQTLNSVSFPVIEGVPPVVYLQKFRRDNRLSGRLDPPLATPDLDLGGRLRTFRPCNGSCEQFAGIFQGGGGGGGNSASIVQSGPNAAVIAQLANGGANVAAITQTGACNQASIAQAAAAVSNTSIINQMGYKNSAVVIQH